MFGSRNFLFAAGDVPINNYGKLFTWSNNNSGQLGQNNTTFISSPVQVGAIATWTKVASGKLFSLAIKQDGTLWAWGKNNFGQLGQNNATSISSPVQIGAGTTWKSISVSQYTSFAIKTDGTMWAWGENYPFGQMGVSVRYHYSSPKQIGALTTWDSLGKPNYSSWNGAAIKTDGTMWMWGRNDFGQLGIGVGYGNNRSSPVQVLGTNWKKVQFGNIACVALKTDGTIWSWGCGYNGRLGHSTAHGVHYSSPKQIGGSTDWADISTTNESGHAVKTGGTMWAWGYNGAGRFGNDTASVNTSSPIQIGALTKWSLITASGSAAVLATKTDNTLWAWGSNTNGVLGLGNTANRSSPVQVGLLKKWVSVSVSTHSIGILSA